MDNFSVLITGGGTGGHIFPGISLYEEFKLRKIQVSLLVGKKDINFSPLSKINKNDLHVYGAPVFTINIFKMPFFMINFLKAVFKAAMLFKRLKIDSVIGMGGYVSAPALAAAGILKIPVFLCEQNSVPGKVTLFFAGKAKKIFTSFNITKVYFKDALKSKVTHAGNPIRKVILTKAGKEEAKKYFHLGHCKNIILVIGGSQGALQINELFLEIKKMYSNELKDTGVIWITGEYSYKKFKDELGKLGTDGSVYLSPFIDDIGRAYKASTLAISRSGAGGVLEFASVGLPSVLIPYPYAADNHQEKNADAFELAGASVKIRKDEAEPEKLGEIIIDLLSNVNQLSRMAEKAKSLAKINAARDIVEAVAREMKEK
ncbi:MAG: undecaprenyldiphospho-muramoylpentapeptide beta-N-acetylglucosaminyltransferase [Spirochaetes bacterium]|nr:undecaprenyldiphospho-muramoylpentapeptide beta-N-acetylglucosaminyltransferase [Spirochaetota bacterium]